MTNGGEREDVGEDTGVRDAQVHDDVQTLSVGLLVADVVAISTFHSANACVGEMEGNTLEPGQIDVAGSSPIPVIVVRG